MKHLALALAAVLLFGGCSEARRMEKKRLKAEALVKEAIETYPDIVQPVVQVDTITVVSPAVVIKERIGYSQASVDSLRQICTDLLQAAKAENKVKIVERFRDVACHFDTARFYKDPLDIMVWVEDGEIRLDAMKHAEGLDTAVVTSMRTISTDPCPPVETVRIKSQFWLGFLAGAVLIGGIWAFFGFMRGSNKYE
jgi:hypothetical protein